MRTAVVTIAHGRHDHWRMQRGALARTDAMIDDHVLVAIDDPDYADLEPDTTAPANPLMPPARVLPMAADPDGLPLAAARNRGARAAIDAGAELLIFLDVDCLPAPGLVDGYVAAASAPPTRGLLLCGPVTYLPPPTPGGYDLANLDAYDAPHPARPAPRRGETSVGGPHELFWSLSFALDAPTWVRIGGFGEDYVGYGGEDTDFGQRARAAGVQMAWVGGARAYHQYHPTTHPPAQHIDAILRNGAVFAATWGWWPMQGWLDRFERDGLIERDTGGGFRRRSAA